MKWWLPGFLFSVYNKRLFSWATSVLVISLLCFKQTNPILGFCKNSSNQFWGFSISIMGLSCPVQDCCSGNVLFHFFWGWSSLHQIYIMIWSFPYPNSSSFSFNWHSLVILWSLLFLWVCMSADTSPYLSAILMAIEQTLLLFPFLQLPKNSVVWLLCHQITPYDVSAS